MSTYINLNEQLLASLTFLHTHQLVVRDLRPSGVLLDDQARPRLSHFGVMRALLGDAESEPPENGMVCSLFSPLSLSPPPILL